MGHPLQLLWVSSATEWSSGVVVGAKCRGDGGARQGGWVGGCGDGPAGVGVLARLFGALDGGSLAGK